MPYAIDLFCGAGGMSEGLIQAGFHILFSSDINEQVEVTYRTRHDQVGLLQGVNTHYERADVNDLTGDFIMNSIRNLEIFRENNENIEIDALFGGPPCQGFSLAGKRKQDDPRNMLFKEYLRIISEIRPKYVVMENVEGFMTTKLMDFVGLDGDVYYNTTLVKNILLEEFRKLGYDVLNPKLLDASDYGVPQRRKRAIFIAYLPTETAPAYPEPMYSDDNKLTVLEAIGDLIANLAVRKKYNRSKSKYQKDSIKGRTLTLEGEEIPKAKKHSNHEFSFHSTYIVERFSLFQNGENTANLRKRIKSDGIELSNKPNLLELLVDKHGHDFSTTDLIEKFRLGQVNDELLNTLLTKKNNRTKLCHNKQASTVVTLPDDYISPFENRIFSVRELARLQSFDDSFVFQGKRTTGGNRRKFEVPQYTQVGNAVPPLLSKAIALEIIKALNTK